MKYIFFIVCLVFVIRINANIPYALPPPETDISPYMVNQIWPEPNNVASDYPPYIFAPTVTDYIGNATFMIRLEIGVTIPLYGIATGSFIKTAEDKSYICALTAGHVYFEFGTSSLDRPKYPSDTFFYQYQYTGNYGGPPDMDISFYQDDAYSEVFGSNIRINDDQDEDYALILVNKLDIPNGIEPTQLNYVYLPTRVVRENINIPFKIRHHTHGKPQSLAFSINTESVIQFYNNIYYKIAESKLDQGSSGATLIAESNDIVYGIHTAYESSTNSYVANTITPLRALIEEYCEGSESQTPIVYKVSSASPIDVFNKGFVTHGYHRDLINHIAGYGFNSTSEATTSSFISTTSSSKFAINHLALDTLLKNKVDKEPNQLVYVYKIRATDNTYSIYNSLIDEWVETKDQYYKDLAMMFLEQEEWIFVDKIEPELIQSVEVYKLDESNKLVHKDTIVNPNYISLDTYGNRYGLHSFNSGTQIKKIYISTSFDVDIHSASFSGCDATSIYKDNEIEKCIKENIFSINISNQNPTKKNKVFNPILNNFIDIYTPWKVINKKDREASKLYPKVCTIEIKEYSIPKPDELVIKCSDSGQTFNNYYFDDIKVNLCAGGSGGACDWVNYNFDFNNVKESALILRPSDIPVVHTTNKTLADYGYSIHDVFSGEISSWISSIIIYPIYPSY